MSALEKAIEEAAAQLPKGWCIQIEIANRRASAFLFTPASEAIEISDGDGSLAERVARGVQMAKSYDWS